MSNINPMWTAYNAVNNEGGEGYNPHSKLVSDSDEPEWSILEERSSKMRRVLNGMSDNDSRYAAKRAEYEATNAAYQAAYKAYLEEAK